VVRNAGCRSNLHTTATVSRGTEVSIGMFANIAGRDPVVLVVRMLLARLPGISHGWLCRSVVPT